MITLKLLWTVSILLLAGGLSSQFVSFQGLYSDILNHGAGAGGN